LLIHTFFLWDNQGFDNVKNFYVKAPVVDTF